MKAKHLKAIFDAMTEEELNCEVFLRDEGMTIEPVKSLHKYDIISEISHDSNSHVQYYQTIKDFIFINSWSREEKQEKLKEYKNSRAQEIEELQGFVISTDLHDNK